MSLKLSAADWCYLKDDSAAPDYYRGLKALGVEGVEMAPRHRYQAVRDAGLQLINIIGHAIEVGLNRRENHPVVLGKIRESIEIARAEKLPHIIVFSGNRQNLPQDEGVRNCVEGLRQVADDAARANVTLLFEVLNSYDHADYDADNSRYAFDVVKQVASPSVKVLYDLYHMYRMGEDIERDVVENLKLIGHLHVAGSPKRNQLGDAQEIDYGKVVRAIVKAGYAGWWGLEFLPESGDALKEIGLSAELMRRYAGR
jgi:hydroxypyruvate isomerase